MTPIGWTVCNAEGSGLLSVRIAEKLEWIPLREAVFGLGEEGNVIHVGCEERASKLADMTRGRVVTLYASVEEPREKVNLRAVGLPLRLTEKVDDGTWLNSSDPKDLVRVLRAAFPREPLSDDGARVYERALREMPHRQHAGSAVMHLVRNSDHMPTVAQLSSTAKEFVGWVALAAP